MRGGAADRLTAFKCLLVPLCPVVKSVRNPRTLTWREPILPGACTDLVMNPSRALVTALLLLGLSSDGCIQGRVPTAAATAKAPLPVAKPEPFPIPIVELSGTPAEIGAEHGRRLGSSIRLLHDQYLDSFLRTAAHRLIALAAASAFETHLLPEHRDEVDAMASEAGIDSREAMLGQCFLDLTPMTACSTLALPASAAPDHVARFGRNLDFPSLNVADKYSTVFICRPRDRYAFAAVGWPGLVGVLSGMNEHGLALANMEVTRGARLPTAMPYTLLYRTILEECRTVDEAIALLKKTPRQTANNLMLMDACGARAVAEIRPEGVEVRRGEDGVALISTNKQRGPDADSAGRCWRYDTLHRDSAIAFGQIDLASLETMLANVEQGKDTLQSMIFEPENRVIYLAVGKRAAEQTFHRLDLKGYFGS